MRPMRFAVALTSLSLVLASSLSGCSDDPLQPGSITAKFTLFPKTCADLGLAQVRAQARTSDGTVENEAVVACTASGEVVIDPVAPGSYTVIVDGLSDEATPRATHAGKTTVVVAEGRATTASEVTLTTKPGSVHVRWVFADGFSCVDNKVTEVEIKLLDEGNVELKDPVKVACQSTTFIDPEDGEEKSGVLFEDISPLTNSTFDVVVRAFDASGTTLRQGVVTKSTLAAGERKLIVTTLEPVAVP